MRPSTASRRRSTFSAACSSSGSSSSEPSCAPQRGMRSRPRRRSCGRRRDEPQRFGRSPAGSRRSAAADRRPAAEATSARGIGCVRARPRAGGHANTAGARPDRSLALSFRVMRAANEHERKLDAPAGYQLPPLGGEPLEARMFTSVYYDVPGCALAAVGITLRRRTERGRSVWQLKLPSDDSRLELEGEGGPRNPPQDLVDLLHAHLRHGPLGRVAELRTRRRGALVARNGSTAEVTVDEVTVLAARRVRERFVEVELELRDGSPTQLDVLADELLDSGAERGPGLPKVFRALDLDLSDGPPPDTPFEA